MAATNAGAFVLFDKGNLLPFFLGLASVFIIMFEVTLIQQKCVDLYKRMNPEKTASVYDAKFEKKWIDSCDEAEKVLIGKCAMKAYSATNLACVGLASLLAACALFFEIGFLPSLSVCIIWAINQFTYHRESMKLLKPKK